MNGSDWVILLGGDHETAGEVVCRSLATRPWSSVLAAATEEREPQPRRDPNEDACGVSVVGGDGVIAVVADAHWGRFASEAVVRCVLDGSETVAQADPTQVGDALKRVLRKATPKIADALVDSECAVCAAHLRDNSLWWASVGDCRCYVISGKEAEIVTPDADTFLGSLRGWPEIVTGSESVSEGDRILLATDGLFEPHPGSPLLTEDQIAVTATGGPVAEATRNLVELARQKGGEEEMALVLGQLP